MPEANGREFYDLVTEIKVELGVINTKVDYLNDIKAKAEDASQKADKALSMGEENREDIRDMKANTKWMWGTIISVVALLITLGIALLK